MHSVVVLIPIYKDRMTLLEKISFCQANAVLHRYPIMFIAPEYMKSCKECNQYRTEFFGDDFFVNTESYSRLLLSEEFYERFSGFSYMLIYQLDAFVFSDRLQEFCDMGYDYIGAPWPRWMNYTGSRYAAGKEYRPLICRGRVGNGGFSLRRISAMISATKARDKILAVHPSLADILRKQEDMYFAYYGAMERRMNLPNVFVAADFSCELDSGHRRISMGNRLPFGCHGWAKFYCGHYKAIIESYGYQLPDGYLQTWDADEDRKRALGKYLLERLGRTSHHRKVKSIWQIFPADSYVVWGNGMDGKLIVDLLLNAGVHIGQIFDSAAKNKYYRHIPVTYPNFDRLKQQKSKILIGTMKYEDEISALLIAKGMREGTDFVKCSIIIRQILHECYLRVPEEKQNEGVVL